MLLTIITAVAAAMKARITTSHTQRRDDGKSKAFTAHLIQQRDSASAQISAADAPGLAPEDRFHFDGDMAQEVRAVVWQSEGCRFDPTLGVSKCP